ncbi:MAG: MFS transporter [Armatimonadota bacterium]
MPDTDRKGSLLGPSAGDPAAAALRWDLVAAVLSGLYLGCVFPFLTRIARAELGATAAQLSLLSAAPFVGNLLTPLWAAKMEGRRTMPFLMASWIPARALLLATPWLQTSTGFVATLSTLQWLGAFASPAYASVLRDIYPDPIRGRMMGYVRVAAQTAAFLGAQYSGRLMDQGVGYRILFPFAGLLGICGALAFSQVDRHRFRPAPRGSASAPVKTPSVRDVLEILVRHRGYRWFAASVMIYGFGNLMSVPLYGLYQVDVLHLSNTEIAHLANIASLSAIPASFLWGRHMDRYGPARTCMWSILCVGAVGAAYLFGGNREALMLAAVFSGIGFAGVELAYLQSILRFAGTDENPARYQALHAFLLGVRGVLAPTFGLQLLPWLGYRTLFAITLVLVMLGAWIQGRVPDTVERDFQ